MPIGHPWTVSVPDNDAVPKVELPSREDALTVAKELFWPFAVIVWPKGREHRNKVLAYFPDKEAAIRAAKAAIVESTEPIEGDVKKMPRAKTWVLVVDPDGTRHKVAPRGYGAHAGRYSFEPMAAEETPTRWPAVYWRERAMPFVAPHKRDPKRTVIEWTEPGPWRFWGRFKTRDAAVDFAGKIERFNETMGDPMPADPKDVSPDNLGRYRLRPFEADVRIVEGGKPGPAPDFNPVSEYARQIRPEPLGPRGAKRPSKAKDFSVDTSKRRKP
jgi:hypothetical protein